MFFSYDAAAAFAVWGIVLDNWYDCIRIKSICNFIDLEWIKSYV